MSRPNSVEERVREALKDAPRTGYTTAEVMRLAKDDRPTIYGALNRLRTAKVVQSAGGKSSPEGRKDVRWRLKLIT